MNNASENTQTILIVEDSEEDYTAVMRAFKKIHLVNPVVWCKSGQEALDYLRNEGQQDDVQQNRRPGIILLDLNMPGIDGHEVLRSLKGDDSLKRIPVIILTTSSNEHDVTQSFQAGANSYIQKPVTFDGLIEALNGLKEYWLEISLLPRDKD